MKSEDHGRACRAGQAGSSRARIRFGHAQMKGFRLGDLFVSAPHLYAFIAAVLVSTALWFYLARSWTGRAIRAVAQDPMASILVGVDAKRTYAIAFGLGVGLTAFGGAVALASHGEQAGMAADPRRRRPTSISTCRPTSWKAEPVRRHAA
jgi:branched-subunit amino acid ABC-type transport system permease component